MFAPIMVLGTVQTATRPKALWVGGVDVIKQSTYAVPIESVVVDNQGPGSVSSMSFTVECTTVPAAVIIGDDMDVRFYKTDKGWSDFYGFVDHVDIENMPGNRGTRYKVQCTGIEAVLDWSIIASDLVIPAATNCDAAAQSVFANATGTSLGRLKATSRGVNQSDYTDGIVGLVAFGGTATVGAAVTVTAGTTLREALRQVAASFVYSAAGIAHVWRATVDFEGNLRFYDDGLDLTAGYTGIWAPGVGWGWNAVDNDTPGTYVGENTTYGIDAAQTRGVLVKGTGVTVFVADGSGKEGPVAVLSDTTITTQAAALAAGTAYVNQYLSAIRGSFEWQDRLTPDSGNGQRPGGYVSGPDPITAKSGITDQRLGLSQVIVLVTGVTKTYNPSGRENWVVSFGGAAPSVTDLTRQLTRSTLS